MKVIIRNMENGLYLYGKGTWGASQDQAMDFKNFIAALVFCVTQRIHNVEILLLLGDHHTDVPLRLFPRAKSEEGVQLPGRTRVAERDGLRTLAVPNMPTAFGGRAPDPSL